MLRRRSLVVLLSCSVVALFVASSTASAQGAGTATSPAKKPPTAGSTTTSAGALPSLTTPLPVDPQVRVGKLPNGVRYYVRRNGLPKQRAELRLVVNAGSVLEDDDQRGLAHLVEHMAFNGTSHFAKKELVDYLESIGMRFGADVNAHTGFDETVYELTLPTDTASVLVKGVQILEDWAHNVSFDQQEIDRERGVVVEEWRLGRGAGARMRDKEFPVLFQGSRYADRLPIGDKNIIEHATRDQIVRFYKDWYRPDLMTVVAVGDFDPAQMVARITKHFSALKPAVSARPRTAYPVPDHDSTLIAIATDTEATSSSAAVYYKQPVRSERTVGDYRRQLIEQLYNGMLNSRLSELTQKPNPPFLGASSSQGRLVRTKEAYVLGAGVQNGGIERGLGALLTEAERVDRFGFTGGELDREKRDMLRGLQQSYDERDKTNSSLLAEEYVRAATEGEAIPGIPYEYRLAKQLLPGITLKETNQLARAWITDRNRVILVDAPQKDSVHVPDRNGVLAVFDSVRKSQITAYRDSLADAPLVANPPAAGTIASTKVIPEIGVTEWTLSNGIRVLLKPTDFKNDELLVRGYGSGGTSLAPDSDLVAATTAATVVRSGGAGPFNLVDLQKKLAGRAVGAGPYISDLEEGIVGGGSPRDADALFQLMYLYIAAPREDSSAYMAYQSRVKESVANRGSNPQAVFQDTILVTMAQHNPRARPATSALYDEMNLRKSLSFYRQRFADVGDFTVIIVGSFTLDGIKPLVLQYLGGLPSSTRRDDWRDVGIHYPEGVITRTVSRGVEPKAQTQLIFHGLIDYTRENVFALGSLAEVMTIRLRETLREDMGGTYGVSVQASPSKYPRPEYELRIGFGSAPERTDELTKATLAVIDSLKASGATSKELAKVKETDLRERETNLRQNGYWLSALYSYDRNGWDPRNITKYESMVGALTSNAIRDAARKYLDTGNYARFTLVPEARPQ